MRLQLISHGNCTLWFFYYFLSFIRKPKPRPCRGTIVISCRLFFLGVEAKCTCSRNSHWFFIVSRFIYLLNVIISAVYERGHQRVKHGRGHEACRVAPALYSCSPSKVIQFIGLLQIRMRRQWHLSRKRVQITRNDNPFIFNRQSNTRIRTWEDYVEKKIQTSVLILNKKRKKNKFILGQELNRDYYWSEPIALSTTSSFASYPNGRSKATSCIFISHW